MTYTEFLDITPILKSNEPTEKTILEPIDTAYLKVLSNGIEVLDMHITDYAKPIFIAATSMAAAAGYYYFTGDCSSTIIEVSLVSAITAAGSILVADAFYGW
jgi:hypothetical protein